MKPFQLVDSCSVGLWISLAGASVKHQFGRRWIWQSRDWKLQKQTQTMKRPQNACEQAGVMHGLASWEVTCILMGVTDPDRKCV